MRIARPNSEGFKVRYASRYGNFIGGEFVRPAKGKYLENPSPVTGQTFCEIPRSTTEDSELALDAAHGAKVTRVTRVTWSKTSAADRARKLRRSADAMEQNLERLAVSETSDGGKPVRAPQRMTLDHRPQTKNDLVSYDQKPMGLF